jgi:hypothetical protein
MHSIRLRAGEGQHGGIRVQAGDLEAGGLEAATEMAGATAHVQQAVACLRGQQCLQQREFPPGDPASARTVVPGFVVGRVDGRGVLRHEGHNRCSHLTRVRVPGLNNLVA